MKPNSIDTAENFTFSYSKPQSRCMDHTVVVNKVDFKDEIVVVNGATLELFYARIVGAKVNLLNGDENVVFLQYVG